MKNISRLAAPALIFAALLCVLASESRAVSYRPAAATSPAGTVPNVINYQGRLVDNGFPVTALRNISFRLYDSLVGPTNLLWSSGPQTVSVNQGLFGTTLAISTQALAGPAQKFLEVQVDAQILSPREPLNAVPYALVAKSLEDNVNVSSVSVGTTLISSGTLSVASIQALNGNTSFGILSPMIFAPGNKLGLGAANPASLLHMSSGTLIIDGNIVTALTTVGNVGIGLTGAIPNAKLQVANSVSAGPGSPDLIVGDGSPAAGNNTQVSIYRGAALGSYIRIDSYRSGAGAAPLILNGANGGSVGIGVTSFTPGALLDVDGTAQFGGVGTKSAFNGAGALTLANNAALTLSGANGNIVNGASVTASAFFGNGANLSNVPAVSVPAAGVTAGTFQNAAYTFQNIVNHPGLGIWNAAGNVGVGTVNPATKIHMSSGTLTIDGAGGTLTVVGGASVSGTLTAGTFSGPISGNATSATNVAGGAANQIPYQSGASATTFVTAPGANVVLAGNSGAPGWSNTPTFNGANLTALTAANISAGTAGINISGTAANVTTNANLTGPVTSVGNATTIVSPLPALNGANLTALTAANISAGTAGINISGTAANVTTNANLTGNVTSVGNATTIAVIPAVSGAALTSLTPGNISAGTAGISITGNAATATIAGGHTSLTLAAIRLLTPPAVGQVYYCSNCASSALCVSTGTVIAAFSDVTLRTTPCQ
ncbi:MAG: beta strand repeat-containing protein [Elusimicrobiota bacterium]